MFKKALAALTAVTLTAAAFASLTMVSAAGHGDLYEGWRYTFQDAITENPGHFFQKEHDGVRKGAMFFDAIDCNNGCMLVLNSDVQPETNGRDEVAKFGKDKMENFTIEFDMNVTGINQGGQGGLLALAFNATDAAHMGNNTLQVQFNNDTSSLKAECPAAANFAPLEGTNLNNPLTLNGPHHIVIQKTGNHIRVAVDDQQEPFWDYTLPEALKGQNGNPDWPIPAMGYIGFEVIRSQGYIANVKVTNGDGFTKTYFADYGGELKTWSMGGINKDDGLAMIPNNGTGLYGKSVGEFNDNHTTTQYMLPLDLKDFSFEFTPEVLTYADDDAEAWMGFALTNKDRDFDIDNPRKGAGLVGEIKAKKDKTAVLTLKSLLEGDDEAYGKHSVEVKLDSFEAGQTYKVSIKNGENGADVYWGEQKVATLDWLKDVYEHNLGYFTFTGSVTAENSSMEWVIEKMNNANAVNYESPAEIPEPTDPPTEPTDPPTEPTDPPTEPTDPPTEPTDPGNPITPDVPQTGVNSFLVPMVILIAVAAGALLMLRKKANR